jgi:hypothetical protein
MKLIGNPWIVGLLGLGAVVVVVFNTFHPHGPQMPTPATGRPSSTVVINSLPAMPGSVESAAVAAPLPTANIDLDYVRLHLIDWLSVTQRDPFFLAKATAAMVSTNAPVRLASQLHLKAIWRQDGVAMAAIDDGIYRLGDNVEGRKVERITYNGVWLEYNGKKDLVVFEGPDGETNTNTP